MLMSDSNDILAIRHLSVIMLCCISYFEGCPDVYIYLSLLYSFVDSLLTKRCSPVYILKNRNKTLHINSYSSIQ